MCRAGLNITDFATANAERYWHSHVLIMQISAIAGKCPAKTRLRIS
ncbi:hypothetical protein [Methylomonas fluvii]|nr:hypothetical protein [Methylomonas fluvii]